MREVPPTAGLPLHGRDLLPWRAQGTLASRLEALLGLEHVQVTCSGTAALVIALSVLAAESDRREVIVPAYTCPLVAMAVRHCGLELRMCDLRAGSTAMDTVALSTLAGPQTLAIVPTYLGGRVHDIEPVLACARSVGAMVVEDAAQALGARHADGTPANLRGDVGIHSLAAGKGLTMFEGGLLVTRHAHLRAKLAQAGRAQAPGNVAWELRRSLELLGYAAFYRPSLLGLVYGAPLRRALRRGDIVAAAGDGVRARIPMHRVGRWRQAVAANAASRLRAHNALTAHQAQPRVAALRSISGLDVLQDAPGARGTWPVLLVLLPSMAARDAVLRALWGAGVGIGVPFARALPDYARLGGTPGVAQVPVARDLAGRVLSISNSPWLDDGTFARIVDCINHAISASMPATAPG
jgi:dTDP-4-amino-4,6-dideoxygalactose transaminase